MKNFADRLIDAVRAKDTPACVGLDPNFDMLPAELREAAGENPREVVQACAILLFNRVILDIIAPHVPVVKPQSAFYESIGPAGSIAYEGTIQMARRRGLIVIGDAKRGDIGSTAQAYAAGHLARSHNDDRTRQLAAAWKRLGFTDTLPETADTPYLGTADALTVNAYLGYDGVKPFIDVCRKEGTGIFILVKTSNPSSAEFQDLKAEDGEEVFVKVAKKVDEWGSDFVGEHGYSSVGAVVGATWPEQAVRLRKIMPRTPFLVPGYGAQGGSADDVKPCFNPGNMGAIVNSSRGIIYAWKRSPYKEEFGEARWREAVEAAVKDMVNDLPRPSSKDASA